MPQTYKVTLSDGRVFNVTTEGGPPSENDVLQSLGGHVDMTPEPAPAMDRFVSSARDAVVGGVKGMAKLSGVPGLFREGVVGAVKDQAEVVRDVLRSQFDQYQKAKAAEREGRWSEMIGHSVAAAIPGVGPMAAAMGEQAATGDIAGAAGAAAGNLLLAAPAAIPGVARAAKSGAPARRAARVAKATAASEGDFVMAMPPSKSAPYTVEDVRAARPFLNEQRKQTPVASVEDARDVLDSAIGTVEQNIESVIKAYPTARVTPKALSRVKAELSQHVRPEFVEQGLKELEGLGLDQPKSLPELEALRKQMNAENQAVLKRNNYDRYTARQTDPGFAAREIAAADLRDTTYGYLQQRGASGVRDLRRAEGSLIKLRNAAERHIFAGDKEVAGSGKPSLKREIAAQVANAATVGAGGVVGSTVGAGAVGAVAALPVGQRLATMIRGGRLQRNALVERAFAGMGDDLPTYPTAPAVRIAGELPPAPIMTPPTPDTSYVRGVPAEPARRIVRGELPPGRPTIVTPPPRDTSGRIPFDPEQLPEHYVSQLRHAADPDSFDPAMLESPAAPAVGSGLSPQVERSFMLRWLADDLREMPFQPSSRMGRLHRLNEEVQAKFGETPATWTPRAAGTPTLEMFHALGIKGSRAEIAAKIESALTGRRGNTSAKLEAVADAMREAWDGQRFDFDLLSDETIARLGVRRRDLRSPVTMPNEADMPEAFKQVWERKATPDPEDW